MIDLLKPVREIVAQLNKRTNKSLKILVHGVGKIKNVEYHKHIYDVSDGYAEVWKFTIKLNDGIIIKCQTYPKFKELEEFLYFEEGDYIEFFGEVHTKERGLFCQNDVEEILIYDAKLSEETRCFTEVLMWNIKKHKFYDIYLAVTVGKYCMVESKIACVGEIEPQENTWAYGQLVKKGKFIILELVKMIGDCYN